MGVGDTSVADKTDQKLVDIKFSDSSLSYADKLLLKKHRRTEIPGLSPSPTSPRVVSHISPRNENVEHVNGFEDNLGKLQERDTFSLNFLSVIHQAEIFGILPKFHHYYFAILSRKYVESMPLLGIFTVSFFCLAEYMILLFITICLCCVCIVSLSI